MGRDGELLSVAAAAQSYRTLVQTLFTSSRKKDKKKQLKKKEKENLLLPSSTLEGILTSIYCYFGGIPGSSDGKESICSVRDLDLIPGLGRSSGEGHGNPLQYSCLENPHGQRSLVGYSPGGGKESDTTERLSTAPCYFGMPSNNLSKYSF